MNQIYLDHAATTPVLPEVCDTMISYMKSEWGNPSSLYDFSDEPRRAVLDARAHTAALIHADPKRIFFTSGGSESDSWALIGCARLLRCKGNHIIVSAIEHHAILHAAAFLEDEGFDVTYLMPDAAGFIHPESLLKAMRPDTILVSIMMANNEIGTIEPIKELAAITHKYGAFFHTDAVQALGHIKVDVRDLNVDFLSASSHKFNGPKGTGFLFVKKGSPIKPFISGGYQEQGNRAGTENVAAVVGMATALQENVCNIEGHRQLLLKLEETLIQKLKEYNLDFIQNGNRSHLPGIVNLSFKGQNGELILHRMDLMGCCISTGSACDSVNNQISHVIKAIQVPKEYAEGTIRISFGKYNTLNDAADIATMINSIINVGLQKQG